MCKHELVISQGAAGSDGSGVAQVLSVERERHNGDNGNQSGRAHNGSTAHSSIGDGNSLGNGSSKNNGNSNNNGNSDSSGNDSSNFKKNDAGVSLFGSFKAPVKR